jgi:hypothetical protein
MNSALLVGGSQISHFAHCAYFIQCTTLFSLLVCEYISTKIRPDMVYLHPKLTDNNHQFTYSVKTRAADISIFNLTKVLVAFLAVAFTCTESFAQSQVSKTMVAGDSTVIMSVSRVNGEIFIELNFAHNFKFDRVSIERKPEFDIAYSQCRLISYSEVEAQNFHVVKRDNYPFHNSADVSYRVRVITFKGSERIYPSIMLPAAGH